MKCIHWRRGGRRPLPRTCGGEGRAPSLRRPLALIAPSVVRCLAALCSLLATPALAGPLERIEPRLAKAIAENRVFMTCTSLDVVAAEATRRHWSRMVARARTHLVAQHASPEELAAFDTRTAVAALVDEDQPLVEAVALCRDHAEWFNRYGHHEFVAKIDETPLPQRR